MNTRFCTTCQTRQPEEGGYKRPKSIRAWRCASCLEKVAKARLVSSKPIDEIYIDRMLKILEKAA